MPRVTTGSPDAPHVQLLANPAHRGDPCALDVIHDAFEVRRALNRILLDLSHGIRVAYLLAPKRSRPIGVPEALYIRPAPLSRFLDALSSSGQSVLRALANQACLQLSHSGHLSKQEATHRPRRHRWKVTEHEVNAAGHEGPQEVYVAGETVELGEYELGSDGFGVREGCCQLRTVGASAALRFHILS